MRRTSQITSWVDDHDILLYEYEGQIRAISKICRHFEGPMGSHKAKDGVFMPPRRALSFHAVLHE